MDADNKDPSRAADEAAAWFARLNQPKVSNDDIFGFRAWRRAPDNAKAYSDVEAVWRQSAQLRTQPEIRTALDRAFKSQRSKTRPGAVLAWGGLALAASAVGVMFVALATSQRPSVYETAIGEQRTVALQDGSTVKLDTDTRVTVRFDARRRLVALERGQALFSVVHRSDQPFQVEVGQTRIDDLGTVFDVRKDMTGVRVTLVSGLVNVENKGARAGRWSLHPGEVLVAESQGEVATSNVDAAKATSWTSGQLYFDDIPLSDATAEVNRYGRRKIILDAGSVGAVRVSGAFQANDTDAFVAAVAQLNGLVIHHEPDGSFFLSAPVGKPSV